MITKSSYASSLIMDMERGRSVLLTLGKPGRILKRKIAITGFVSRLMLFLIFNPIALFRAQSNPNVWHRRRIAAIRLARFFFPFSIKGHPLAPSKCGQVIVINHPTLNDPLCAILYALDLYPGREIVVPVNLPWFESICRYRSKLLKIGINIVPILTPETAKRLGSESQASSIQTAFMSNYIAEFTKALANGGTAVVAQQATRQRYIFSNPAQAESGDGILSTISLILVGIRRAKLLEQTDFVPVGVIPHSLHAKSRLNPFCTYTLNIGQPILATELSTVKNAAKRPADLFMLQRLAELLPVEYHFAKE